MLRRIVSIVAPLVAAALISSCNSERYHTIEGAAQGGVFKVTYSVAGNRSAEISRKVFKALEAVDQSVSGYNPNSLLSRFNSCPADSLMEVDSIFASVFNASVRASSLSGGAFDASAAPLFDLWGFGFTDRSAVTRAMADSVLEFVGMEHFSLKEDGSRRFISKDDSRARLNFNAIAQGWSCDLIASILEGCGSSNYLVDIGEIMCRGVSPRGEKWRIGVDRPIDGNQTPGADLQSIIEITDCGVVTSGNYRKYFIEDGRKYSHTIDPVSGYPVSHNLLSATVLAPDATTADACATWFMAVGLDSTVSIVTGMPDLKVLLIYDDAGRMETWSNM